MKRSVPDSHRLRWCFSTLGCPEASLSTVLSLASRYGIRWVELRALNDSIDLPGQLARECGDPAGFARRMAAAGVGIAAIDTGLRLADCKERDREDFLRHLPWAEALGGVPLRVFDGGTGTDLEPVQLARIEATMAWWEKLREGNRWRSTLLVETHDGALNADVMRRIMHAAPDSVRLLWDVHHPWKKVGGDPLELWREIRPWVRHVHIKDSISIPCRESRWTYVHLGHGEFPLATLLQKMAADGFAGPISIEWERKWHSDLGPLDALLDDAKADGFLQRHVGQRHFQ